jgi:hypothetical protein
MMTATSTRAETTPIKTPRIGVICRIAGVAAITVEKLHEHWKSLVFI